MMLLLGSQPSEYWTTASSSLGVRGLDDFWVIVLIRAPDPCNKEGPPRMGPAAWGYSAPSAHPCVNGA